MTKQQYIEMAQDISRFAGMIVTFRVPGRKMEDHARLMGVGVYGNKENFILQRAYGGRFVVHYHYIKWPSCR